MAQMTEQNKTSEKELNESEITNLSDAQFKKLMTRMLKELIEYSNNVKEEMKVTMSEIKKNLQGIISGWKEARIQINDLEHKEEISIQPEQQVEKRIFFKKREDSIRTLWNISTHTNIHIIGMPEREEGQDVENLFKKIMK